MGLHLKVADLLAKDESDVEINEDDIDLADLEDNPEEQKQPSAVDAEIKSAYSEEERIEPRTRGNAAAGKSLR